MSVEFILAKTEAIAVSCREPGMRQLWLLGSAMREDFGPDNDLDFSAEEYESSVRKSLFDLVDDRIALEELLTLGRPVDLVPIGGVRPKSRERILSEALSLWEAA